MLYHIISYYIILYHIRLYDCSRLYKITLECSRLYSMEVERNELQFKIFNDALRIVHGNVEGRSYCDM